MLYALLDFTDERKLNMLSPQEQAELLYIAHKKEAFVHPFIIIFKIGLSI